MFDERLYKKIDWKGPVDITKEQWIRLLKDREITTEKDMHLLQLIFDSDNCMGQAEQLRQRLDMRHRIVLNRQVSDWGKRIVGKLNIPLPRDRKGEECKDWNVPFWGMKESNFWGARTEKGNGVYWILRPELEEAMRELHATEISLGRA